MSEVAAELLTTFDSLPIQEQREVLLAMIRRTGELPEALIAEHELVSVADELFQMLDGEEAVGGLTNPR